MILEQHVAVAGMDLIMKTSEMFPKKGFNGPSFEAVNAAALNAYPGLLQRWFPAGRVQGHEFVIGNVNGDKGRSLSVNTTTGVWSDFGDGNHGGSDPVSLYAARCQIGQGEACKRLAGDLGLNTNYAMQPPAPKAQVRTEWKPILPAPCPPPHHPHHSRLGQPSQVWQYRNCEGQLLFLVCRFDRGDGGKDIVPLSYGVLDGKEGWHWKAIADHRPLYGLDRLQASPKAKVLLVEGEKTADAAQRLLPSLVAVTWPGGGKAAGKTDWSPLKGREVLIWPDADKPGRETAEGWYTPHGEFKWGLAHYLNDVGGTVRVVEPPANVKEGWDLADAEVEGWDTERVVKWIKENMREAPQPSGPEVLNRQECQPSDGWPDPDLTILVAGRREPPGLPLEVFGNFWGNWIAGHAKNRSVPVDYVAGALLASSSALIGNTRWVSPWPGWSEPPVLWIGEVGKPSSGKSPGQDAPLNLLCRIEADMAGDFPETLRAWETQREAAKAVRDQWQGEVKGAIKNGMAAPDMPVNAIIPDAPVRPRINVSDATPEQLGKLLAAHARGLLFHRDELSGWLGNFDRYGGAGGDRAFWSEAFGGRPYTIDRVKYDEPILIPHLSVAVVGGIQPDKLRTMLISGDDDGLPARFLFVWPHPIPPRKPHNTVDDRLALDAFRRLHAIRMAEDDQGRPCPLSVRLSGEAADLFQEWRLANYDDDVNSFGMYASHIGKLPGLTLRLALVLEYLKWSETGGPEPKTISIETTGYAAHLIDKYFKPMALRVYGDAALPEAEHHAAGIAQRIIKDSLAIVNVREIQRGWRIPGLATSTKINDALEVLLDADVLRPAPSRQGDTPGRNRSDFEVNPRMWRAAP